MKTKTKNQVWPVAGAVGELRCELKEKENRTKKKTKNLMWPVGRGTQELMGDEKPEEKHHHMQNVTIHHSRSLL